MRRRRRPLQRHGLTKPKCCAHSRRCRGDRRGRCDLMCRRHARAQSVAQGAELLPVRLEHCHGPLLLVQPREEVRDDRGRLRIFLAPLRASRVGTTTPGPAWGQVAGAASGVARGDGKEAVRAGRRGHEGLRFRPQRGGAHGILRRPCPGLPSRRCRARWNSGVRTLSINLFALVRVPASSNIPARGTRALRCGWRDKI